MIRCDDEDALWSLVRNVHDLQVPPGVRLTDGNPNAILSGAVLSRPPEHLLHVLLADVMSIDVRLSGFRVGVEANIHFMIL